MDDNCCMTFARNINPAWGLLDLLLCLCPVSESLNFIHKVSLILYLYAWNWIFGIWLCNNKFDSELNENCNYEVLVPCCQTFIEFRSSCKFSSFKLQLKSFMPLLRWHPNFLYLVWIMAIKYVLMIFVYENLLNC